MKDPNKTFTSTLKKLFEVELEDDLETRSEKKRRHRSLYIVHTSMLVVSLGSSIIFTGVYPYLLSVDRSVTMSEYGYVVAADATAQMIFSPIFGLLADKLRSVRLLSLLCCLLFSGGNILYALVGYFDRDLLFGLQVKKVRFWTMLISRIVVGSGTAINSTGRYYISLATRLSERTTHIAYLSLFQTIGFILGPAIQVALTPLGVERTAGGPLGTFYIDMFTATGWVSASSGLICVLLYLPMVFNESYISHKELDYMNISKQDEKAPIRALAREMSRISLGPSQAFAKTAKAKQLLKTYSRISVIDGRVNYNEAPEDTSESSFGRPKRIWPPLLPTLVCIYCFFSFLFNFVLLETIVTPLAMHNWGWNQATAIQNIGLIMIAGGILSIVAFIFIGPLSKRFDERVLLICAGLVPMLVGRVVMFPIPGVEHPPLRANGCNSTLGGGGSTSTGTPEMNFTSTWWSTTPPEIDLSMADLVDKYLNASEESWMTTTFNVSTTSSPVAKPPSDCATGCPYDWCNDIPKITIAQFMVGYVVATCGYPFCLTLTGSIYSKVLGNIPQGVWLALLTTSGSLARVVGPLFVTDLYQEYGTYATFGLVTGSLGLALILIFVSYWKLVPTTN